ncbi:FAD-binding oxidoreductase [Microbacterium sp. STN6]|uniref:FAD-binding oxidoreductase n=1 Tax=Microbacterium sp. STN6 TaxID=2995588 RepID=UPI002260A9F5|nr:FAD-binding oxidoreductase [Microbacterium sp. STN6]MCX7522616.1 FAD-binding oxidoreductase [Microbacterium sp. STN6]
MTDTTAVPAEANIDSASLERLRATVRGPVLTPDDPELAVEAACFNIAVTHRPAVVVGATDESDVVEAVRFAVAERLNVRVQSTGHAAIVPITDGLLITTSRMNTVTLDPESRLATIGAGARWGAVIAAGAEYGLAPIVGSSPGVGAIGLTLGGGIGPLARSHGITSDWARSFRVVTASGDAVTASASENLELFWALRGGKGGLGIVTEMTLELAPLRTLYAGGLFFDGADDIEKALRAWGEWVQQAPDNVTTSVAIMQMPDFEMVPPPLRGHTVLHLRFAYPGDAAEGERLIAPLREAASVYIDAVAEIPYTAVGTIHNDPEQGMPTWIYGTMLTGLDHDAISAFLEHVGPSSGSPFMIAELRHLGGAMNRADADGTAVSGRDAAYLVNLITANPQTFAEAAPAAAAALVEAFGPLLAPVTNINFSGDPADPLTFARSWNEPTHERLRLARSTYDPNGVFAFGPALQG